MFGAATDHAESFSGFGESPPRHETGDMDRHTALSLAVAAARHGPGAMRLSILASQEGVDTFRQIHGELSRKDQDLVRRAADALARNSIFAVLMGAPGYPRQLASARGAPAFLFCRGPVGLLSRPGIGICGPPDASEEGLGAARICAQTAADLGLSVVAGYAAGVGAASHAAALSAGGCSVVVVAEGINRVRPKRDLPARTDPDRTLVVSQFAPTQARTPITEKARNTVVLGLARALLVIETREAGATLAAAMRALDSKRPVLTIEHPGAARGNAMLHRRGAIPVHTRADLSATLQTLTDGPPRKHPLLII
jgi:DNA processing protein